MTLKLSPCVSVSGFGSFLVSAGISAGHCHPPEMIHHVIAADDFVLAVLLLAILARFRIGPGAGERDRVAVGRPGDRPDAVLLRGQLRRLAAGRRDHIDLPLAVAIAGEGQPARIGRPLRPAAALLAAGQLVPFAGGGDGDPDLRNEIVLVPIGLLVPSTPRTFRRARSARRRPISCSAIGRWWGQWRPRLRRAETRG